MASRLAFRSDPSLYLSRSLLFLTVALYLLFLLSADWMTEVGGAWYRPHLVALAAIAAAALLSRQHDGDEF